MEKIYKLHELKRKKNVTHNMIKYITFINFMQTPSCMNNLTIQS